MKVIFDPYVFDVLMPDLIGHDKQPSAFIVYAYLWRRTFGEGVQSAPASLRQIAEETGLSKSAVQSAMRTLLRRRLLKSQRRHSTATPVYTVLRPWIRPRRS